LSFGFSGCALAPPLAPPRRNEPIPLSPRGSVRVVALRRTTAGSLVVAGLLFLLIAGVGSPAAVEDTATACSLLVARAGSPAAVEDNLLVLERGCCRTVRCYTRRVHPAASSSDLVNTVRIHSADSSADYVYTATIISIRPY
jgi:hypothetical protein